MDADVLEQANHDSDDFVMAFVTVELPFSNWSSHKIAIWGETFPTAEHAYQYRKFRDHDPYWAGKIKRAKSASEAKKLGWRRKIDSAAWDRVREPIMRELLAAKVAQHEDVLEALLNTGDLAIVEKGNLKDNFWGIGPDGKGQNTLGKIWMALRQQYRHGKPAT